MHPRTVIVGICLLLAALGCSRVRAAESGASDYEAYIVRQGQSLTAIAAEYGIAPEYLAQYNRMTVGSPLTAGQVVLVPITTQLAPQMMATVSVPAPRSSAVTVGEKITGVLAKVTAARTEIWTKPGRGGQLLFDGATRGTELLVIGEADAYDAVLMSNGATGWVPKSAVTLTETRMQVDRPIAPPAPTTPGRQDVVDAAFEYLGTPYRYGGRLPDNVDCSLLVQTVFARFTIKLPRTAAQQMTYGVPVEVADLQPGDRLYFTDRSGGIGHTGIYIGNGRFIHASSNRGAVAVDDLSNSSYWKKFAGARR